MEAVMADEDLELVETVIPGITRKSLDTRATLAEGDKLKTTIGDAKLNTTVPDGETWKVHVIIEIDVS